MVDDVQALLDLEKRRCDAIAAGDGDGDALTAMLDDDYIHIHLNGFEDDRKGHVEKVLATRRRMLRGEIKVRIFGDVAVLNGATTLIAKQDGEEVVVHGVAQQVLVRRGDDWVYVLTHMTRAGDPPPEMQALLNKHGGAYGKAMPAAPTAES